MKPSPFASLPGAVLSDQLTPATDLATSLSVPPIPLHYGDPAGEQWALEAGEGLVDRSDLGIVAVSGVDRQTWLTSLASQIVTGMGPGDSRELLILDPQGHVEYAAAVVDDGQTTFLIVEGADAEALAQWLDSMRFALRVEVALRPDLRVLGTVTRAGKEPPAVEGALACWDDPWPGVVEGGTAYFQGNHPGRHRRAQLHMLPEESLAAAVQAWLATPGHRAAGLNAWEAVRIAAWRPRHGYETDERTIPAELDWLRTAVHISKGCYRGQESVARVLNLGRPPRRLVALQLDGSRGELPAVGTPMMRGARQVGVVTSVARHADEGPIALAVVARNVPVDEVFDLEGVAAAQEVIVPPEGKADASPDERPGAGLARSELRRPDMRGSSSGGLSPR
ncbi:YgfZ/GcvT domain-containing protein [Schaalia canis]|uniref:CAF17-like 4Fe-4S cluster assembly/insertion protein YgfZ n=1 Tax=Schaalia canis TaxID=100469 RepID=UPI00196B7929|nr:folate-binding protein YgfZ [Schaalia canis]